MGGKRERKGMDVLEAQVSKVCIGMGLLGVMMGVSNRREKRMICNVPVSLINGQKERESI